MKRQLIKKIIPGTIIFIFAIFFIQAMLPLQASAVALNWENPNSNGKNPYKFKASDVINSQMIMQVVGCTGIVDSVSATITKFAKENITALLSKEAAVKAGVAICAIGKKIGVVTTSSAPVGNTQEVPKLIPCGEITQTNDKAGVAEMKKTTSAEEATRKREECLNGIAIQLARDQLTAMTKYTMNWVNSGFNGDPMYVRDITSFTNSLEKNVLETGVKILLSPEKAYPYGSDFARTAINGYNSGSSFRSGAGNFLNSLTSDLSNFVTDPRSYYSESALERAQNANNLFANDFSTGGWNAWLSLTQTDANNPLGFAMQTSQYFADQQGSQVQNTQNELLTNNGFLSQKRCVLWNVYDDKEGAGYKYDLKTGDIKTSTNPQPENDCAGYEVVTPGSIIKDKITTYVNSPERQLELVDTINDSLNSLFSALIAKFQNEGLSSLSSEKYQYSDINMGIGPSSNSSTDRTKTSSGYVNGSFDLTRDLGNQFIHNYTEKPLGNWNANINMPQLKIGVAPIGIDGTPLANVYYNVLTPGKTILFENGNNTWEVGDRAFWNGSEWQNWKKDSEIDKKTGKIIKTNPIKKRGILQVQKDYITVARKILMTLPGIMPKIGELDFCIPGPNPNWGTNSQEVQANFSDLLGTMDSSYSPEDNHWFGLVKSGGEKYVSAAKGDSPQYKNYYNNFKNTNPSWWSNITGTKYWKGLYNGNDPTSTKEIQATNLASIYSVIDVVPNTTPTWEARLQSTVFVFQRRILGDIDTFNREYANFINRIYGSNGLMQKEFIEKENTPVLIPNPAYLPMASTGLNITKDIVSYSDDINTTTEDYNSAIITANTNISKLSSIKDKVSEIIKRAQARRDEKLRTTLGLTYAEYMAKYANCFKEEDISYYDDLSIGSSETGNRCKDNIDNDLNGLIDSSDPSCK